ncbi:hypothetical protein C8R47DRAFT_36828 [Mycena vitilis]|nr:hypothetical protein C8R47DRAFT_36828 [Mycena vitilis]
MPKDPTKPKAQGKRKQNLSNPSEPLTKKKRRRSPESLSPRGHQLPLPDDEDTSDEDDVTHGAPLPPVRPKPGRPDHARRGTRDDDMPAALLSGLVPPEPATPPPKSRTKKSRDHDDFFSPNTSRLVNFATHLPIHLQASPSRPARRTQQRPRKKQRKGSDSGSGSDAESGSVRLNRIKHLPENGWTEAGSCLSSKAYQFFEDWKNDYSPAAYFQPDSIKIIHASDPADRQKDIRARPFALCWNTPDFRPPSGIHVNTPVPVFRIIYKCLGHCLHGTSIHDSGDDDDDEFEDLDEDGYHSAETESDSDSDTAANDRIKDIDPDTDNIAELNRLLRANSIRKSKAPSHSCSVKLHAEVYSNDLDRVHFFQRGKHPEAQSRYLDMSPHIRQCIIEMASLYNLPPSNIKRRLLRVFREDSEHPTPRYRRPTTAQVDNAVNYNRRKDRLSTDPLLNIGVFAEFNPDKIFYYHGPNYATNPPTEFATGIHHPYGTQCALLFGGRNGIGYDATWANMNENRAPVTFMITIDHTGRMVPCTLLCHVAFRI